MSVNTASEAWQTLAQLAARAIRTPLSAYRRESGRYARSSHRVGELVVDLSHQRLDTSIMDSLVALAAERQLEGAIERLLSGEVVNKTERRAALHTVLRDPEPRAHANDVLRERNRMTGFADAVRSGSWLGHTGKPIEQIVHVGIGGSHLGPELCTDALSRGNRRFDLRYLANVDGHACTAALAGLDPERCLFIIASKSFTTIETRVNAKTARSWFLERTANADAIERHFVAVSTNVQACRDFGIPEANVYPMWDWVGGRFSLWSAVGLPILLSLGHQAYCALLAGGHAMDKHFAEQPVTRNVPALLALTDVWNYNFLGATSHAVLPYDTRLALLPDFLQQLQMESNGKRVTAEGTPVGVHTAPVVWGGVGTNSQHSFHQLLHQGTRSYTADFIVAARPDHPHTEHQHWLLSNCLAQIEAMADGQPSDDPHRAVPGNHPTTAIVMDALTPFALGELIALYEHRTYCQGVIWGINSFDQWGVELGKRLAVGLYEAFARGDGPSGDSLFGDIQRTRAHA